MKKMITSEITDEMANGALNVLCGATIDCSSGTCPECLFNNNNKEAVDEFKNLFAEYKTKVTF